MLEVLLDDAEDDIECKSSEEMQRAMEDANEKIEERGIKDAVIFSTDVDALYPSLDTEDVLEAVEKLVMDSEYEFENVEDRELAKYLKIVIPEDELEAKGLVSNVPKSRVEIEGRSKGSVSVAYLDTDTYSSLDKGKKSVKEKWVWEGWMSPCRVKRKLMLSLLFREQVRVMMTNHLYTFGGQLYRQGTGGPIGLKLTSTAARGVLRMFDREYKSKLADLKLELLLDKRYVDDKNKAAREVPADIDVVAGPECLYKE